MDTVPDLAQQLDKLTRYLNSLPLDSAERPKVTSALTETRSIYISAVIVLKKYQIEKYQSQISLHNELITVYTNAIKETESRQDDINLFDSLRKQYKAEISDSKQQIAGYKRNIAKTKKRLMNCKNCLSLLKLNFSQAK